MYHCFRLTRGDDLKRKIEEFVLKNRISGAIVSGVGSLSRVVVRLAGAQEILATDGPFEIVGITGTLSENGVHIHIAVSDATGKTIGGHLKDGCMVDTTAEIILLEIKDKRFKRKLDHNTGYEEIIFEERN